MSATNEHVYFSTLLKNETTGLTIMIRAGVVYSQWNLVKYWNIGGKISSDKNYVSKQMIYDYLEENDLLDMKKFTKDDFTEFLLRFNLI